MFQLFHSMGVDDFINAYVEYVGMAKDDQAKGGSGEQAGQPSAELPGVTFDEAVLKSRPSYELGCEHRFFLKRGRRCSVDTKVLAGWTLRDWHAFKLGLE